MAEKDSEKGQILNAVEPIIEIPKPTTTRLTASEPSSSMEIREQE